MASPTTVTSAAATSSTNCDSSSASSDERTPVYRSLHDIYVATKHVQYDEELNLVTEDEPACYCEAVKEEKWVTSMK